MRQNCTYGNMAESELLCVRVAALLTCKDTRTLRDDVIMQHM